MDATELRRRLPRAEREEQLLSVAQAVFAERGFRAPSMDEIAVRAGVTKPVLYDHFGSKDGLVAACIRRAGEDLLLGVAAAAEAAPSLEETFRAGFAAFFDFVETHGQGWFALIGENSVVGPAAEAVEAIRHQQATYVEQQLSVALGGMAPDEVAAISQAIIGACERLALWRRDRVDISAEQARESLMALLWDGLVARIGGTGA